MGSCQQPHRKTNICILFFDNSIDPNIHIKAFNVVGIANGVDSVLEPKKKLDTTLRGSGVDWF